MKKMIEQLKEILNEVFDLDLQEPSMKDETGRDRAVRMLNDVISALQNPTPITPEQYTEQEGHELTEEAAVYVLMNDGQGWVVGNYKWAKEYHNGEIIVCAKHLDGPPPIDWRPEQ
jgi:hypothetical protein